MQHLATIVLTGWFLFTGAGGHGQSILTPPLLGQGAYSKDFEDVFSGLHNGASLAQLNKISAGIFLEERFSMKALRTAYFGFALPVQSGTFSLHGISSGYQNFVRQEVDFAYARKLFDWLDAGLSLSFLNMRIPEYGSSNALTFTASILALVGNEWCVGLQAFNPSKVNYRKLGQDKIPDVYRLGIGYQPSKIFLLTSEINYSESDTDILLGFQYRIAQILSIRAGISTGYIPVFAGIKLHLQPFEILISASYHEQLGLSPGAGFIFLNGQGDE